MKRASTKYAKNAGAVYSLKYHVVWCPKYRRKVLVPPINERLKQLIVEAAAARDMTIHALEVMPDHVHLFIETDPRWAVAELVGQFKASTSRVLRDEFPSLRSRLPTLWSRSYYAGTVGHVSAKTVEAYIASQKGR